MRKAKITLICTNMQAGIKDIRTFTFITLQPLKSWNISQIHQRKWNFEFIRTPSIITIFLYRPNLITLIGFCFASVPFVILFAHCGSSFSNDKDHPIPSWFFLMQALFYFMYRMFDEMDGKQARRTGNSSPLGLLFDHGCDAFSMGFQLMVGAKSF